MQQALAEKPDSAMTVYVGRLLMRLHTTTITTTVTSMSHIFYSIKMYTIIHKKTTFLFSILIYSCIFILSGVRFTKYQQIHSDIALVDLTYK